MNVKDILLPIVFGITSIWLVQYIFSPKDPSVGKPGSEFVAPTSAVAVKPLNLEIDFFDNKNDEKREAIITTVEFPHATWSFSSNGAVVENLTYKRVRGSVEQIFNTITPSLEKERGAFIVALQGLDATPYFYTFKGEEKLENSTTITYQATTPKALITKQFEVMNDSYTLNLTVTVEPKSDEEIQPRIFFPAPLLKFSDRSDEISAVVYGDRSGLTSKKAADVTGRGWELPPLFGAQDRYFAHVMIKDAQSFARRTYYKPQGVNSLQAILEGPSTREKSTWTISFYCGPKESDSLSAADPRLESLLDYGWFAPISKPMLYLLKLLYNYVHNYGWAILLLTLLIKLFMLPLTINGERAAKASTEIQRKMAYLDQKYKHDTETLNREKAELIKKNGMSMLGCLPILLQIPVFIGLQRVLGTSLELYKAPFLWMNDLSQSDPYYILPLMAGLGMALQMMQTGNARQRMTNGIIAIVITALSSTFSAGLLLFIAANTLSGVLFSRIQKALKI